MAIFGRRTTPGSEIGFGDLGSRQARASVMGSPSSNGWVYRFGGLFGTRGGTVWIWQGLYTVANNQPATRLVLSDGTHQASNVVNWQGNLLEYTRKSATAQKIYTNQVYALHAGEDGPNVSTFGQDHSGHQMHTRNSNPTPSPFSQTYQDAQGRMTLWVEYQPNRAPNTPHGVGPTGFITNSNPILYGYFSDPDETLPGFSLGQADKISAYRFEVWNQAQTVRLHDSGKVTANTTDKNARYVSWQSPTQTQTAKKGRLTVWDEFDVPSVAATWDYTVNAGGAAGSPHLHPSDRISETYTDLQNPRVRATWSHSGGLSADRMQVVIQNSNGANLIGPQGEQTINVSPGNYLETSIGAAGGSSLLRGGTFRYGIRARDTSGLWSPWAYTPYFVVNKAPDAPSGVAPVGGISSQRPTLSAVLTDATDPSSSLTAHWHVRPSGGSDVYIGTGSYNSSTGRHEVAVGPSGMPSHGTYEFRVIPEDPYGRWGPYSSYQTFIYAEAPAITIATPTAGQAVTTGTPTISGTVDKAITSFSVVIRRQDNSAVVHESGTIGASGSSFSHDIPGAILSNLQAYNAIVTVTSIEGVTGSATRSFSVDYPHPSAIGNVVAEPYAGPFEPAADPRQWSYIRVEWSAVGTSDAPEGDFRGYVVYRTGLDGNRVVMAHLGARGDTVFIDRTPDSSVLFTYEVAYLVEINDVDVVESVPESDTAMVTLRQSTLSSLSGDGLGVVLTYWEDRAAKPVRRWEEVPGWGKHDILFQAPTDYKRVFGSFRVKDDDYGTFRAGDVIRALEEMGSLAYDENGIGRPRVHCYRDPFRTLFVSIVDVDPHDTHLIGVTDVNVDLVEVDARPGVSL